MLLERGHDLIGSISDTPPDIPEARLSESQNVLG